MKNLFDQIKSGNFGDIGTKLNSALGGNVQDTLRQAGTSLSNAGAATKEKMQGANVGGMLGSAAVGGLLGAIFAGKQTKKMAKSAVQYGGAAALGGLAFAFYQKWSNSQAQANQADAQIQGNVQNQQDANIAAPQAALPPAENTALILIEAMVYAARADGHIDDDERNTIHSAVASLFPGQEMADIIDAFIQKPIDPHGLAARVVNKEEGLDLYRLSCAAVDIDSFMERSYLDGLANALGITKEEQNQLEAEAANI